jgi:hypothetical protein
MQGGDTQGTLERLTPEEAVGAVAASARRLFPTFSPNRARELAGLILRDLEAEGVTLAKCRSSS